MFDSGPGRLAVIFEKQNVAEAPIVFQIEHAVAISPQNFFHAFFVDQRERLLVIGRFDDHFVRAHSVHTIEKAFAFAVQSSFDPQRRKLVGHHSHRPSRSVLAAAVAPVGENLLRRLAFIARAERANSWVAFYVHTLPNEIHWPLAAIGGDDDPASGNGILAKLRQTFLLVLAPEYSTTAVARGDDPTQRQRRASRRDAGARKVNDPAFVLESSANWVLVLAGVERALVQADYRVFAAGHFDGRDVEVAGGSFDGTREQKLFGHARKVAALLPVHGCFGRRPRGG